MYPAVVPSPARRSISTLSLYQDYRCRHSGVCCSAGWHIPIDHDGMGRVAAALETGSLRVPGALSPGGGPFLDAGELPDGAAAILARTASGECVFFDRRASRLCAIQRTMGHAALPAACRHFPRVILIEDTVVRVAFSHVCPTAADLLFREDVRRLEPVPAGDLIANPDDIEGFDAAHTVPPFVRPQVVGDADSLAAWDAFVLAACDRPDERPPQVVARLALGAERLRAWSPERGSMSRYARDVLGAVLAAEPADAHGEPAGIAALYGAVRGSIPAGLAPTGVSEREARAAANWSARPGLWRVANRYLAARAWGSWSAYLGWGVRTQVAWVAAALAVLSIRLGDDGDRDGLRAALGQADVMLVHQADTASVCAAVARVERLPYAQFLAALGVAIR